MHHKETITKKRLFGGRESKTFWRETHTNERRVVILGPAADWELQRVLGELDWRVAGEDGDDDDDDNDDDDDDNDDEEVEDDFYVDKSDIVGMTNSGENSSPL